jgi:hypothetical protein
VAAAVAPPAVSVRGVVPAANIVVLVILMVELVLELMTSTSSAPVVAPRSASPTSSWSSRLLVRSFHLLISTVIRFDIKRNV